MRERGFDEDIIYLDTTINYKVSSFLHLHNVKLRIDCYLILVCQICLGTMVIMVKNRYSMNKTNLKVQAHLSATFVSLVAQ